MDFRAGSGLSLLNGQAKERQLSKQIMMLCQTFTVIAEDQKMLIKVFENEGYKDIEDGMQMECASEKK